MARIVEVKRRLDGSELRYECALVHRAPTLVVALYRFSFPFPPPFRGREWVGGGPPQRPLSAPRATRVDSYGFFWARRPYLCYHMVRPRDGSPLVTRFDVLRDMDLRSPREVRYTDLLLDLWVEDGIARWEDEHEVNAAARAGTLSRADRARIRRARAILERRHQVVTAEVRRLLRSLGRIP